MKDRIVDGRITGYRGDGTYDWAEVVRDDEGG
jgi:hypothetical protein